METFVLFVGAPSPQDTMRRLERGLDVAVPRAGAELVYESVALDEMRGGLVCVRPDSPELRTMISFHERDQVLVVSFGRITGTLQAAAAIHAALAVSESEGIGPAAIERARGLDGSYAAIIVDRRARTAHALTDIIGCRSLSWFERDGRLVLSPHALGVVAAGDVPLDWDTSSVASSTCVDWSVGRTPFLRALRTQKPYEVLRWAYRPEASTLEATVLRSSPLRFDERISRWDRPGLAAHGDAIAATMIDAVRAHTKGAERIPISLTAGLDSRATLGMLHAAGLQHLVHAQTNGKEGSADVEGARRLAAICGIPHERRDPAAAASDDFEANVRLNAFLSNGDTNAKQCLARAPTLKYTGALGGAGGEIYTGFYYPVFLPFGHVPDDPDAIVDTVMLRLRKARWSALDAWGSPLYREARQRLAAELHAFRALGAHGSDLADLLYLWERYGHWGALGYRRPWSHGFTPFATPNAVRGLFRYPRAAGKYCDVHVRIIKRHLPLAAYLMPVNGSVFLPLRAHGEAAYVLRQGQTALSVIQKRVSAKLRTRASEAGMEQIWAGMFASEVHDYVRALITHPQSLSSATFGQAAVTKLLEAHRKNRSQLQPLGALVMADQFKALADAVARA